MRKIVRGWLQPTRSPAVEDGRNPGLKRANCSTHERSPELELRLLRILEHAHMDGVHQSGIQETPVGAQTMFCPSCGTQILNEQKYCRACGMELEPVAALVAARGTLSSSSSSAKPDQQITFRAVKLVAAGASFFLSGAILSFAGRMIFQRDDVVNLGVLALLFGLVMILFAFFQGLWAKTRPRTTARTGANTQPNLDQPNLEQPNLEQPRPNGLPSPMPSVTESTTKLMEGDRLQLSGDEASGQPSR